MLYATTPGFLERLGLPSLAALPSLAPLLEPEAEEDGALADSVADDEPDGADPDEPDEAGGERNGAERRSSEPGP